MGSVMPNKRLLCAAAAACLFCSVVVETAWAGPCTKYYAKQERHEARADKYHSMGDTSRAKLERMKAREYGDKAFQCDLEEQSRWSREWMEDDRRREEEAETANQILQFGFGALGGFAGGGGGGSHHHGGSSQHQGHHQ